APSSLWSLVAAARFVRREAPFAFEPEPGPGGLLVTGVVDVLAHEPDGSVLVVDYKTNPLDVLEPPELTARDYEGQRLVYALAALRNGAPRVEVAHCYLERPDEPASAAYGPADAPALAERLVGLAGGLLAGDFAVTDVPHRELCGSCPGRRALCSHPEALTLRPMPSVDTPAAADGPAAPRRAR
ncbi:MAG: PD-(D/E)XK nuclease family protein, partial [Solirubrobacteraceae bacterium]